MSSFLIKRLLSIIPLLIGISLISFFVINLAPGGPTTILMDPKVRPEDVKRIKHNLGLDKPLHIQYFNWLNNMLQGNFGKSIIDGRPVLTRILEVMPNTLILMLSSFLITLFLAIPLGIFQAVKQYSFADYFLTFLSFLGISVPSFWLGLMLIYYFSFKLNLLPSSGVYTLGEEKTFIDLLKHLILPSIALSVGSIAGWSRYQRSQMLEVLRTDYVRTARAKGLSEKNIIFKHSLRNALIPIITLLGLSLPDLLGGAYITETIFAWPGMGRLGVEVVFQRDYPVIMGLLVISAVLIIMGNLIADILYALVDPRIRYN